MPDGRLIAVLPWPEGLAGTGCRRFLSPAGTCLHPAASEVTALALWVPWLVCSGAVPAPGRSSSDCQTHRGTWRGAHPLQGKLCCRSHEVKWWLQSWGNSRRRTARDETMRV